ncbi:beta-galactosidase [Deinococcus metalli]|uniref:Beta-galactosidase n=1 Tax=Deinococcus metalli TaxID=1141878 RepID=A0A7W8NPG2_9DEIO|nr:beta-galactosidase [Deinococcus metalli]MBB5375725.1 beta-galactosidase [Deinococcus metalli]GHF37517.1 beta-galactosidase [Deinococcus metalli]
MAPVPNVPHVIYGADYNPEQWPPEVWREDVALMQEAGVNLVSLGIFSWALLECAPGEFDFAWLDEVMDLLHAGGIGVNLATATASPPPWLATRYPDSRPVTVDGVRLEIGGRQAYCPSHQGFRDHVAALVRAVAQRYGTHPAVQLWHVNNEYGCHVDQCYCELCAGKFREWLRAKYSTLDALNAAWGTAFWSQHYGEWTQIQPPRRAPTYANPTQQLDWRRFSSDNILELYALETGILRDLTPDIPVTTNFLGFLPGLDYFTWAKHEDVASLDAYPDPHGAFPHLEAGMQFDLTRSLRRGQRWILMEEATSAVNWRAVNGPKPPGLARLLNHQALAHGANGIMYFQWRASRAGAEKYHSALVQHPGPQRSRVWREVVAFGEELRTLTPLLQASVPTRVGLVFDWNSWWALELDSKPARLPLMPLVQAWYAALRRLGQTVDFVHPASDLSGYDLLVMPNSYLLSGAAAANVRSYVQGGGHVVTGFFSGIVDEHEHVGLGGYPAALRDVLGVWVEEWVPLRPAETTPVRFAGQDAPVPATTWAEVVHLDGAEVLATFEDGYYGGGPAITRHAAGSGQTTYVATHLPEDALLHVLRGTLTDAGIPHATLPAFLDVTLSETPDGAVLHLLNADPTQSLHVTVPGATVMLDGSPVGTPVVLEPYGVRLVRVPAGFTVADLDIRTPDGT